ncbi:MAG: PEP-CTERM sorting domain-containing protein [Comamonadaceae bacterium]|nr:PEP-CTERM sorting domain-containing protein [Comamonadaceae bacterium]
MIDWSIWASGGDKPSGTTALFSGSMAPSLTDMGNCTTCYKRIEYLLDVPDFNLAAGDYWVGFHVTRGFEGLYWAQTANGDTKTASGYVSNSGTAWYPGHPNSSNYPPEAYVFSVRGSAASVSSVPEPETYTMVLAGLGLIGAIARRRRASRA